MFINQACFHSGRLNCFYVCYHRASHPGVWKTIPQLPPPPDPCSPVLRGLGWCSCWCPCTAGFVLVPDQPHAMPCTWGFFTGTTRPPWMTSSTLSTAEEQQLPGMVVSQAVLGVKVRSRLLLSGLAKETDRVQAKACTHKGGGAGGGVGMEGRE